MAKKPVAAPDRISPLEAVAHPGRYGANSDAPGVDISERLCDSLAQVQAWPNTLAKVKTAMGKVTGVKLKGGHVSSEADDIIIMPAGPGRYLIEDESDDLEGRLRAAISSELGAVTGLSHARVIVALSGEKSEWVLSSLVAIDFSIEAFPVGTVQLSHHHEIGLTIHRTDFNKFDLYVFTSYARGFWHAITTSAQEVGYTIS